ncbi:hypothetical protein [Colwellia sp. Bg11-28]|uniref:hypothetical protein n=1 Tax=Colwellia sp. Bg11-28 TaxID=2058305 RepID=UPI000C32DB42|nr:hypothetical protein [Colwellia sp. Bg11-28]PKH89454.1 hypothetical protein CXF79_01360 [Colwellia sp. Bg11-28]
MHAILSLKLDSNRGLNLEADAVSDSEKTKGTRGLKIVNKNNSAPCSQPHVRQVDESLLTNLAPHQLHAKGANKCCQCAYNSGFEQGSLLQQFISLDIESLGDAPVSDGGDQKSVHQAFALGYSDGVNSFIKN